MPFRERFSIFKSRHEKPSERSGAASPTVLPQTAETSSPRLANAQDGVQPVEPSPAAPKTASQATPVNNGPAAKEPQVLVNRPAATQTSQVSSSHVGQSQDVQGSPRVDTISSLIATDPGACGGELVAKLQTQQGSSRSQELWENAFDNLEKEAELLQDYMKILVEVLVKEEISKLSSEDPKSSDAESKKVSREAKALKKDILSILTNQSEEGSVEISATGSRKSGYDDLKAKILDELQDREKRQMYMRILVENGKAKFEKSSKYTRALGSFAQSLLSAKPVVDLVIQATPQAAPAAVPWAGVCLGLQILSNPGRAAESNLNGIAYVTSRMSWYCALVDYLLNPENIDQGNKSVGQVLEQLEENIVTLYQAILCYQMQSICSYYRNQGYNFIRQVADLDGWDGALQNIKDAETALQGDFDACIKVHARNSLHKLVITADETVSQLWSINETLKSLIDTQRQQHQDDKNNKCRQKLFVVNPRDDLDRIENSKDKLLRESFEWVLRETKYITYTSWSESDPISRRLLWIKGDAGTGKTMLMIGIIRTLSNQPPLKERFLSYFFCEGTSERKLRSATTVLRTLMWMLLDQQPYLISHLQDAYEPSGDALFEYKNAFFALKRVFEKMLGDPDFSPTYFVVDALDECDLTQPGLNELLELIFQSLKITDKVKWLLSSRPEVAVPPELDMDVELLANTTLQLDPECLGKPVEAYIEHRLAQFSRKRGYDTHVLAGLSKAIHDQSMNTFLWVALAFKSIEEKLGKRAIELIKEIPPGLTALYDHMMARIEIVKLVEPEDCKKILAIMALASKPLSPSELETLAELDEDTTLAAVEKCGSFLTIVNNTIGLIHQSAKEYLVKNYESRLNEVSIAHGHINISIRSINSMSSRMKQNMCGLGYGYISSSSRPLDLTLLTPIQYPCVFWVDHLRYSIDNKKESQKLLTDAGDVLKFLKKHFLHWMESLSLLKFSSVRVESIENLLNIIQLQPESSTQLLAFLLDAKRFIIRHGSIIDMAPLQAYGSALVFSPTMSEIRNNFWHERLPFIQSAIASSETWTADQQTLEGHRGPVSSVVFSPDGTIIASASSDGTTRLWNAITGTPVHTLTGLGEEPLFVAVSSDGKRVATTSSRGTMFWDTASGAHERTLEEYDELVAFSRDGMKVVTCTRQVIEVCDTATGIGKVIDDDGEVCSIAISPDGAIIATGSNFVRLWDSVTGSLKKTIGRGFIRVISVAFSPDSALIAFTYSHECDVWLWNIATGKCQALEGHTTAVTQVTFSQDGTMVASSSTDSSVRLWYIATGGCHVFEGHSGPVMSVALSPDGRTVASASSDRTIRLWNVPDESTTDHRGSSKSTHTINQLTFSPDGKRLASIHIQSKRFSKNEIQCTQVLDLSTAKQRILEDSDNIYWGTPIVFSPDGTKISMTSDSDEVRVWDAATGKYKSLGSHDEDNPTIFAFSPDGRKIISATRDDTLRQWNVDTGEYRQILSRHMHAGYLKQVVFSLDGQKLATTSLGHKVGLWDDVTGKFRFLIGHSGGIRAVAFAPDGNTLASASSDKTVRLWNLVTGDCHVFEAETYSVVFSSDGKTLALTIWDGTVQLWDVTSGTFKRNIALDLLRDKPIFSLDGPDSQTNRALININIEMTNPSSPEIIPLPFIEKEWIMLGSEVRLWLPPDCRGQAKAFSENSIALAHTTGGMTVVEFKKNEA